MHLGCTFQVVHAACRWWEPSNLRQRKGWDLVLIEWALTWEISPGARPAQICREEATCSIAAWKGIPDACHDVNTEPSKVSESQTHQQDGVGTQFFLLTSCRKKQTNLALLPDSYTCVDGFQMSIKHPVLPEGERSTKRQLYSEHFSL